MIAMDIPRTFAELGRRPAAPSRTGRPDPLGTGRVRPQFAKSGCRRGHGQRHSGGAGSVALCRPGDYRQPDAGEGDRPCQDKTDKIDARVLAQFHANGFLPEVWVPDERTERLRRLARRNQALGERGVGRRGSAYAYNVKELRNSEKAAAENAERAYELMVRHWRSRGPKRRTDATSEEGSRPGVC